MEEIFLNLIPTGNHPICHASQYDVGRQIKVNLFDGSVAYALQEGDSLVLDIKKPNGGVVSEDLSVTVGLSYAYIVTREDMSDTAGKCVCDLRLKNSNKDIGSLNFYIEVEEAVEDIGGNSYKVFVNTVGGSAGNVNNAPIIMDKIITNFKNATGVVPLTSAGEFPVYDATKSFRIHMRVKISELLNNHKHALIGDLNGFYYMPSMEFSSLNENSLIWAGFSTNRSSWTTSITIEKSELEFKANAWYEIDYQYSASDNVLTLTVFDGENTITKTADTGGNFRMADNPKVSIGSVANSGGHNSTTATIDYSNTYWEEDGVILWGNKEVA